MNQYARSALAIAGLMTVMCGTVIVATASLRMRQDELDKLYAQKGLSK